MAIENYYIEMTRLIPTQSLNNKNEPVRSYTDSTIQAFIGSATDFEIPSHGKITVKTQYRFYSSTKCGKRDIIKYDSNNYRVISDMKDSGGKGHHYKGYVENIAGIDS